MRRRGCLAALLALVGGLTAGCGDEPSSFGIAHVESSATHTRATTEEAAAGADIVRRVSAELYPQLATTAGDGNLAYSPLSIATVLGMTRAGAKGTSAEQIDALLGSTPADGLHRAVNGADETVRSLAGPVALDNDELSDIDLTTANALWGQSGVLFGDEFLDELRSSYDASMWTADFARNPDGARAEINAWVAPRTGEKITDLLPEGSVDEDTRLVLTNAVYFKAPWPERLDDAGTKPFTTAAGDTVDADMLTIAEPLATASGDGWQSVTLPYAGRKLGFTLIVPDEGMLRDVEGALGPDLLAAAIQGEDRGVDLTFPRFDLRSEVPLAKALQAVGVSEPFATTQDFQPMSVDPKASPLQLKDVVHQATVAVDEHGTEAAAATGAVFNTVGGMLPDVELVVDRPFLFVIHDLEHGTPIFLGRVTDPTAG